MPLSPAQAAESLKDIEMTGQRSALAYCYANASPHFLLWGVIWMIGYAGSGLLIAHGMSRETGFLWLILSLLGLAGSAAIGYRQHRRLGAGADALAERRQGLRFFWAFWIITLFINAAYWVTGQLDARQQAAFVPLVAGMFYAVLGLWRGPRLVATGLALTALTLIGFTWLDGWFLYWMAAVGGGALVLTGLWLRTV